MSRAALGCGKVNDALSVDVKWFMTGNASRLSVLAAIIVREQCARAHAEPADDRDRNLGVQRRWHHLVPHLGPPIEAKPDGDGRPDDGGQRPPLRNRQNTSQNSVSGCGDHRYDQAEEIHRYAAFNVVAGDTPAYDNLL